MEDVANGFSLVKQTGTPSSKKDETNFYYKFDVMFDHPVCLEPGKAYDIVSLIKGPSSWYVFGGRKHDEVQGIQFSFSSSAASGNESNASHGQFPALIFSTM